MIRKFSCYIKGAIRLTVKGEYPERFINLCIAEHIYLWGVKKLDDCLIVWITPADFFRIRPIVRKSKMRVKVINYYGLPFLLKQLKKRKMLWCGAVGFIMAIYLLSSYIWFIDIIGIKSVSQAEIMDIVGRHGLYIGASQNEILVKEIEKEIILKVPEIAWVGVRFTGTRAIVEIVEKVMPAAEDKSAGDLVASKSGIVTECIPLAGEKMVKVGDQVKEGDVLIRGIVPNMQPASGSKPQSKAMETVKAQGIVKAIISYESYGEAERVQNTYALSGNEDFSVKLNFDGNIIKIRQADLDRFMAYEHDKIVKKLPWWRNSDFTVETIVDVYHELNVSTIEISKEDAKRLASLDALAESKSTIPEDAYVIEQSIDMLEGNQPNLVRVKLKIKTEEEIGKHIKYNKE